MSKAENAPKSVEPKKRNKKVFRNFAEYWHFLRVLTEDQQRLIADSLTSSERRSLKQSYERGDWNMLFMRNACDYTIDRIKENYGVDLIELRMKVLSGKPQLVQKSFWEYVNACFEKVDFEHVAYILGDMREEEYDKEYVKLVPSTVR